MMKYIKPESLTWWAGFVPIVAGVFIALGPVHGLVAMIAVIDSITGGVEPAVLIGAGMTAIGLRAAPGMNK